MFIDKFRLVDINIHKILLTKTIIAAANPLIFVLNNSEKRI